MATSNTAVATAPADVAPFFLGRQPILDRRGNTVAYELLFRSDSTGGACVTDGRQATASVIAHAFSELGIASVLGNCRGFINFDADTLLSDLPEALPADKIVLEILETVEFTPAVIARCHELYAAGFRLALDDVAGISSAHEQVMPIVDIVKVDLAETSHDELAGLAAACRRPGVELLAEKVDTREQARHCRELGFEYFQGYYFARPVVLEGRAVDPSRNLLLQLLQQVMAEAEIPEIETTFKQSPELSYKLMRLVNSAATGLANRIESLSHALIVLGKRQLARWLQVLLFAHHGTGDFPSPLLNLAATRGKLMELLAEEVSSDPAFIDRAFMAGILSLLDALLGLPMQEILDQIPLGDEVRDALLHRRGRLGRLLSMTEALERSDMNTVGGLISDTQMLATSQLPALQIRAMAWADGIGRDD